MLENSFLIGLFALVVALIIHNSGFVKECERIEGNSTFDRSVLEGGSSVWCQGMNHTRRICWFTNLCYLSQKQLFVFLHGNHTVMTGLPDDRFSPALLDLSSVEDHNTQYFNFEEVPVDAMSKIFSDEVTFMKKTSLLFSRFYTDNIMHVFHDDLLPAYHTLWMIQGQESQFDIQLVFSDSVHSDSFKDLYSRLTVNRPLHLLDLYDDICFRDIYVGVSKDTTWYDYGFSRPQGKKSRITVNGQEIRQFVNFIKNPKKIRINTEEIILVVSRKSTRLILNELYLCTKLATQFNMKVETASLETHALDDIIDLFSRAKVVVGMHGSLLIFALFMRPDTVLVEMFPFAIPPENYTPYKTLTEISGMDIIYRSWRNFDKAKSITHPDGPPDLGGIEHLPESIQEEIINSDEVTPHLCCSDPHWLYRIFQDTIVNVDDIVSLIHDGLRDINCRKGQSQTLQPHLPPGKVSSVSCQIGCTSINDIMSDDTTCLFISWQEPWNIKFLPITDNELEYDVWIQATHEDGYHSYKARDSSIYVKDLPLSDSFNVWVHAQLNLNKGPHVFQSCHGP